MINQQAIAALERFREKYWKEGVVDVGVLESEAAKVGSSVPGDGAVQDGNGRNEEIKGLVSESESASLKALVGELERMAMDVENPVPDACALLWAYYWWEEDEDTAWEWWDRGLDMESPLMEAINLDNMEQEVGEDDWDGEFQAYDDETEAGG